MADELLERIRDVADGQIDFEGQRFAERLSTALLAIVGAIAFSVGYVLQDIKLALFVELGGTALVFLAIVPPWPFFNKSPVRWLSPGGSALPPPTIEVDGKLVG